MWVFDSIDISNRKARMIASGATDVRIVVANSTGLTFAEVTDSGNANFTTVFAAYSASGSDRFVVVTSRHQDILGPFPSQYHGTCEILE